MSKKNKEYDQNIISALKKLPTPLMTAKGNEVLFNIDKRNETFYEHIADKKHHLHVKDIEVIPIILKDKKSLVGDCKSHKFNNYIGRRGKQNEKAHYLKIITMVGKTNKESVVTVYVVKTIDKSK